MKGYIKPPVAFAILLVFAANGMAESSTASNQDSGQYTASARIKLRVVIPEMLLFQTGDAAPGEDTLAFPTSVKTPTTNGDLYLHSNSGYASSVTERKTVTGISYTATSL